MRLMKRAAALVCAAALTMMMLACAGAEGIYYGSYPAEDIYLTQTRAHTCTLIAATMMLRNYCYQEGSPYIQVTASGVGNFAWTNQYGLARDFSIGQLKVTSDDEIRHCKDKKLYLIAALLRHREGVVIYDTGAPHAIWLFGYDEETDTFYCADTTNKNGGCAIPLAESIIRGATQEAKINTIDKIWYVDVQDDF